MYASPPEDAITRSRSLPPIKSSSIVSSLPSHYVFPHDFHHPLLKIDAPHDKKTQSGVATELHEPTQPVYNEFSDNAIFATFVVAGLSVLSLMTLVGVRIVKTLMKHGRCIDVRPQDLLTCTSRFRRGKREPDEVPMAEDDDGIVTDYVHA
jgi:hypothetical protein